MQFPKLFRRPPPKPVNAVVVCVETGPPGAPSSVDDGAVEELAQRLCALAESQRLGEYDGCDRFTSESRLYFFSDEADRLAIAALEVIGPLPWRDRVRVRVSLDPLGGSWRKVFP
ncbi:MAG TPA: hypothetical protein VFZ93_12625 [Albitalea sp.]